MATLAELIVRIDADLTGMQRGFTAAERAAHNLGDKLQSIGRTMTIAVTAPAALLGASVVSAAADMDSLTRALTSVAGSSAGAQEQLKRLQVVALAPGLGFREAIEGSVRLQAVGISARQAERVLADLGNAIALTGGGKTELDRVTAQLAQLGAKGKVLQQDLRPILESAPAVGQALLKAFGTIDPERIEKLHLTSAQFLTALAGGLEQLPHVTGGAKNAIENFSDSLFRARAAVGDQLLPAIVPLLDGLTNLLARVRSIDPETVRWSISIAAVAAVAGPLIGLTGALTSAVAALSAALGIAGLVGTIATGGLLLVLGALSALFVKNKLDALAAAAGADQYRASLIGLTRAQLLAQQIIQRQRLADAHVGETTLMSAGKAFERITPQGAVRGTLTHFQTGAGGPGIVSETHEMAGLAAEANDAGARVAALTNALAQLDAAAASSFTPLLAPATAATDKLAAAREQVNGLTRDFAALSQFHGVKLFSDLPDELQQQIRDAQQLGDEFAQAQRNLAKLGAHAPAGADTAVQALNDQLKEAQRRLAELARLWNDPRLLGTAHIQLPGLNVAQVAPNGINIRGGGPMPERPETTGEAFRSMLGQTFAQIARQSSQMIGDMAAMFERARRASDSFSGAAVKSLAFAAAMQVATGAFEVLGPAINALGAPLRIFGEILAVGIVPVLQLLFPIIKAVVIVLSYLQEAFDRVIGTLLKGIGWFIRGLGKVINALDPFGNPGNPLVKLGEALRNTASGFFDAADAIAKKRKELEGLSFEDAMNGAADAANKLSEALINAAQGFKIERFRFAATDAGGAAGAIPRSPPAGPRTDAGTVISGLSIPITINTIGDGRETYRELYEEMDRRAGSHPEFRPVLALFPAPV